ncbi:hypothetical protein BDZ45DRAFT_549892, partial [Acephala macrosclerotiorum]
NSTVYIGVWMNHLKGPLFGPTLTVSQRDGVLLVAILALFVSLAGSQSWGFIYFIVHQMRTTAIPYDGIHYQRQAVLRNTSGVSAAVWQLGKISWAWRSRRVR